MTLEELQIILKVNNEQLVKGLKDSMKQVNGFNKQISGSISSMKSGFSGLKRFIIGLGIGKAIASSINDGLNAIESENFVQEVFGGMTGEMRDWSEELSKTLGLNSYAVRENVAQFYLLTTQMGVTGDAAKKMSKNLTTIAYDMASFRNKDPKQVFNALQSAMVGNTEALRSMGIVVTMAQIKNEAYAKGIASVGDELTQTQKAMATYSLILRNTAKDQGDMARTLNSPANQLRMLREQLQLLKIEFGKAFAPILQVVLPILNAFVGKLIQVVKTISYFTQALFGKAITGGGGASDAMDNQLGGIEDITGGYEDAAEAAEEYKKSTQGFDELNTLPSQSSAKTPDVGGVDGGGLGDLGWEDTESVMDEIPPKIQAMVDKIKGIFNDFKTFFEEHKELILSIIGGIIAGFLAFETLTFLSKLPGIIAGISGALAVITSPIGIASIAIGGLVTILLYLLQTNEEFRNKMAEIWSGIGQLFVDFWEGTLKPFAEYFYNGFIKPVADAFQTYLLPIFADVFIQFSELFGAVIEAVLTFVEFFLGAIQPIIDVLTVILVEAMKMFKQVWDDHLKGAVDAIVGFVQKVVELADIILNQFILPIWQWLMETFKPVWETVIKAVMDVIGAFLSFIGQVCDGIFTALGGVLDFIIGIFTGDWERAWGGIKDIFKGVWEAISSIMQLGSDLIMAIWNLLKDGVVAIVTVLVNLVTSLFKTLGNALKGICEGIANFFKTIWTGIKDTVVNIVQTISNTVSNVFNAIKNTLSNICNAIANVVKSAWDGIKNTITGVVNAISSTVSNVFNAIKNVMSNICQWVSSAFKNAWSNAWNGVVNTFKNIWNGIVNFVKAPLNFIIDMVNKVINGLNRIKVPDWVPLMGGKGINIPNLPRLAQGGIVNKPTTAIIGEAGPEMVVPLKNTDFVNKLASAVGNAVYHNMTALIDDTSTNEPSRQQIVLKIDSTELGRAAIDGINRVSKMEGQLRLRT